MRCVVICVFSFTVLPVIAQIHDEKIQYRSLRLAPKLKKNTGRLLDKLNEIQKAVEETKADLNKARIKVNQTIDEKLEFAEKEIKVAEKDFINDVDKLKKKAGNVNIDECFKEDAKFTDLRNETLKKTASCISDKTNQVMKYADDKLEKLNEIENTLENIRFDSSKCRRGFRGKKCRNKLISRVKEIRFSFKSNVQESVARIVLWINELHGPVNECALINVHQHQISGMKMLQEISGCVMEKMNSNSEGGIRSSTDSSTTVSISTSTGTTSETMPITISEGGIRSSTDSSATSSINTSTETTSSTTTTEGKT